MGAEESQETRVPAAPPWWLLLLKTHLLCVGLSFPFLPHCSLSNDVRPSPKLISHATEFSSSQAGSLLGDIPSRLLILGNLHPISLCFICFLSIFFLRNASIQKHLQLREAGSRLFFFNAVCTISYYSHLWTLWCLTLPSPFNLVLAWSVSEGLVPFCEGDSVSTSYLSWTIFSDFCPYLSIPSDPR